MNIYIVRHGQTYTNINKIVCGQFDTELTKNGFLQAEEIKKKLRDVKFDFFYVSPLKRAIQTAKEISENYNFKEVPELMEMNTGEYSSLTVDELWNLDYRYKNQGKFPFHYYPNGENLSILFNRITSWLCTKINTLWSNNDNIIIVGHEATVACAIHYFLKIPLEHYPSFQIDNGSIIKISIDVLKSDVRVEFLN